MDPIYKNASQQFYRYSWDTNKNYIINPQAPVYTINGAAGNKEGMTPKPGKYGL